MKSFQYQDVTALLDFFLPWKDIQLLINDDDIRDFKGIVNGSMNELSFIKAFYE